MTQVAVRSLAECEAVIESGLRTFVDVGNALREIRDQRLYREHFSSFEDYCRERWALKRQRAYELMDTSATVAALSEISDSPPPSRESHAAALAPVKDQPEALRETWEAVTERHGDQPTAAQVREVVESRRPAPAEAEQPVAARGDDDTTHDRKVGVSSALELAASMRALTVRLNSAEGRIPGEAVAFVAKEAKWLQRALVRLVAEIDEPEGTRA